MDFLCAAIISPHPRFFLRIAQNERDGLAGQLSIFQSAKINLQTQNDVLAEEVSSLSRRIMTVNEKSNESEMEQVCVWEKGIKNKLS